MKIFKRIFKSEKETPKPEKETPKSENEAPSGEDSGKKKKKIRAVVWMGVAAIFLAVAVVFGVNFILQRQAINRQDAIREAGLSEPASEPVAGALPALPVTEEPDETDQSDSVEEQPEWVLREKRSKPNEREINFEALWELNPDVIAWIEIPGTEIDYPIVWTDCNEHYIVHDLLGHRTGYGALFTDIRNRPGWQDPFIIVYGHNMLDGRKFSDLHHYRGQWFFNRHRIVHIYTPHGQFDYEIFAAYERDNQHLLHGAFFWNDYVARAHLDNLINTEWTHGIFDMDWVTEEDFILALSTCVGAGDRRFIVQAAFIEPE